MLTRASPNILLFRIYYLQLIITRKTQDGLYEACIGSSGFSAAKWGYVKSIKLGVILKRVKDTCFGLSRTSELIFVIYT